jgi:ubiquinone/menaquinone biosynthesis C-methylase UbiE
MTTSSLEDRFYLFPPVEIELEDFESTGCILDIGGGGEGVIGQLKGAGVIAIDNRREELEEAAGGFIKIVMDARSMGFLDESFGTATAFFSMMYIHDSEDQRRVLAEAWRVLKPGGALHLWDVDLSRRPLTDKEYYLLQLSYVIAGEVTNTAYGQAWPLEPRGPDYYEAIAGQAGFRAEAVRHTGNTFYMKLVRDSELD